MNKLLVLVISQFFIMSVACAGDFDWLENFNIKAEADSSGYRIHLSTRFNIGETEVKAVIKSVDNLSDAYMILRMGEISSQSPTQVLQEYQRNKKQSWGKMAKNLGIKPGSKAFHALKSGDDMGRNHSKKSKHKNQKDKNKSKGHSQGGNKGKGNK